MFIVAGLVCCLLLVVGYLYPKSPPGLFFWAIADSLGLAGQNYKASRAMANYRGTLQRRSAAITPGINTIGDTEAEIASLKRQLAQKMSEADDVEEELDIMDEDKVPDDNPRKLQKGELLLDLQGEVDDMQRDLSDLGVNRNQLTSMLVKEKNEIISGQRKTGRLEGKLRRSEVKANLSRQASAFNPTGHDTLAEAEELVNQQIDKNEGRANAYRNVMGQSDEDRAMSERVKSRKTADFLAQRRRSQADPAIENTPPN